MSVLRGVLITINSIMEVNDLTKEVKEVVSIGKDAAVCQNCRSHSNNPSFCKVNDTYTGRKNTCDKFKK